MTEAMALEIIRGILVTDEDGHYFAAQKLFDIEAVIEAIENNLDEPNYRNPMGT